MKVVGSRYSRDSRRLREFLTRNRGRTSGSGSSRTRRPTACSDALGVAPTETAGADRRRRRAAQPVQRGGRADARARRPRRAAADVRPGDRRAAARPGSPPRVYGASEGLDTQAIDAIAFGGQASTSTRIENYLGFPAGVSGGELAERAQLQARRFGARLVVPAERWGCAARRPLRDRARRRRGRQRPRR